MSLIPEDPRGALYQHYKSILYFYGMDALFNFNMAMSIAKLKTVIL